MDQTTSIKGINECNEKEREGKNWKQGYYTIHVMVHEPSFACDNEALYSALLGKRLHSYAEQQVPGACMHEYRNHSLQFIHHTDSSINNIQASSLE